MNYKEVEAVEAEFLAQHGADKNIKFHYHFNQRDTIIIKVTAIIHDDNGKYFFGYDNGTKHWVSKGFKAN